MLNAIAMHSRGEPFAALETRKLTIPIISGRGSRVESGIANTANSGRKNAGVNGSTPAIDSAVRID